MFSLCGQAKKKNKVEMFVWKLNGVEMPILFKMKLEQGRFLLFWMWKSPNWRVKLKQRFTETHTHNNN